ncbi:MAG: hypothetical protein QM766_03115 [Burkholderiaceae bacterium]
MNFTGSIDRDLLEAQAHQGQEIILAKSGKPDARLVTIDGAFASFGIETVW